MVDPNLIIGCQRGEQAAFELLYKSCSTKALRTAYSIANRGDLAEDIVQEAFYECFRDIRQLKSPEAFESWFYKIIVRVCWRMLSNERKIQHEQLDDCEASLKDPVNYFDKIENNVITEAVNRLSLPLRTTVILFYYNDLSVKEIAKVMNCFQGTVKSRLHKGRKKLLEELERVHGGKVDQGNVEEIWKRGVHFERE